MDIDIRISICIIKESFVIITYPNIGDTMTFYMTSWTSVAFYLFIKKKQVWAFFKFLTRSNFRKSVSVPVSIKEKGAKVETKQHPSINIRWSIFIE